MSSPSPSPISSLRSVLMRGMLQLVLLAVVMLSAMQQQHQVDATALTYKLAAYEKACFYEYVSGPNKKIYFYFAVQDGGSFDIDVNVEDPQQKALHQGVKERQGDYVFTSTTAGDYTFCFNNDMSTFAAKVVDFDVTIEADADAENGTAASSSSSSGDKDGKWTSLEESLRKLNIDIGHILKAQRYFRTRENRNYSTVVSTESRIFYFALLESCMIVGMSVLQVYVVRTFFSGPRKGRI